MVLTWRGPQPLKPKRRRRIDLKPSLFTAYLSRFSIVLFAALLLSGCPSDGERTSTFPKEEPVTISGIVANGVPLAGAEIILIDLDGKANRAVSDAQGRFAVRVNQLTRPFILKSNFEGLIFHSVLVEGDYVNLTPLTELIVAHVLGGPTTELEDKAFRSGGLNPNPFTKEALITATASATDLLQIAYGVTLPAGVSDPFTSPFVPTPGIHGRSAD